MTAKPVKRTSNHVTVTTAPTDEELLRSYSRAVKALLAKAAIVPAGRDAELDTLRAVQRRAQPRIEQIEGEGDPS